MGFSWVERWETELCNSLPLLLTTFKQILQDTLAGREAAQALVRLNQGKHSAADYAVEIHTLATDSGRNQAALGDTFLQGLSDVLKDALCTTVYPCRTRLVHHPCLQVGQEVCWARGWKEVALSDTLSFLWTKTPSQLLPGSQRNPCKWAEPSWPLRNDKGGSVRADVSGEARTPQCKLLVKRQSSSVKQRTLVSSTLLPGSPSRTVITGSLCSSSSHLNVKALTLVVMILLMLRL